MLNADLDARAIFIDLDDTLVRERDAKLTAAAPTLHGQRMLWYLYEFAVNHCHLDAAQARERLDDRYQQQVWFDWEDFFAPLGIDAAAFWQYADQAEARLLEPVDPDAAAVIHDLAAAGHQLYIASNNPVSGVAHKLRLAGIDNAAQAKLFTGILATNVMRSMKWHRAFWRNALALTGLPPDSVVVIGDNAHDDIQMPAQVGITRRIHLTGNGQAPTPPADSPGVIMVRNWTMIRDCFLHR